jgi:gamma-glutamyltranspeptidase/glutathione hydrolase
MEAGGNAIDAGVASCLAMAVLQSEMVNVAGVAPMMIYCTEPATRAVNLTLKLRGFPV